MDDEVTSQVADALVGKWFQSYDYVSFVERSVGGYEDEWTTGKTGKVVALLQDGLYLIDYNDGTGEVTKSVRSFQSWRFFPTEADLIEFVSTLDTAKG